MGKKADEDNRDELTVAYMVGYEHGRDREKVNIEKELFDFFMWFRDNGEKHIGITIEELVQKYIDEVRFS